MLIIQNLSTPLLPSVSLQADKGQCIGIHGKSGSGKTLLLRAIADLDLNSGTIFLDKLSREQLPADKWRQLVAYLPAESHWWSNLVKNHFQSTDTDFTVLGLDPEIPNWQVTHLSSGEKQRLALLRALDNNPQVLLLDEVTANLDEENTHRVEQLILEKMRHGLIVIWVSHDRLQRKRITSSSYLIDKGQFTLEDSDGVG